MFPGPLSGWDGSFGHMSRVKLGRSKAIDFLQHLLKEIELGEITSEKLSITIHDVSNSRTHLPRTTESFLVIWMIDVAEIREGKIIKMKTGENLKKLLKILKEKEGDCD